MKKVVNILDAQRIDMGGIGIDQAMPIPGLQNLDPFLLIHHWAENFSGNQHPRDLGVGPHPHRGFSPVTLLFEGALHHRDSRGNDSVVAAPGAQWMHAGMGIVHSERPPVELAKRGGPMELIQFWINVPASDKMVSPTYQAVDSAAMPRLSGGNNHLSFYLVAGKQGESQGPVAPKTPMIVGQIFADGPDELVVEVPKGFHVLIYILDGQLTLNQSKLTAKQVAFTGDSDENVMIRSESHAKALFLAGVPIREEIVQYGPFVMNSQTEVMQALRDYQMGKMGVLIEEFE